MKVIAIYHKDCNDGTMAAALILRKFPEALVYPLPYSYTEEDIQEIIKKADSETIFYTVDGVMGAKNFLNAGYKVVTIDHHIGAFEEYKKISDENKNFTYIFDNNHSGSSLTWLHLFPDENMPELVKYVEDSDLFIHKYGQDTKDVHGYLSIYQNNPEEVLKELGGDLEEIKKKGKIISEYYNAKLKKQLETLPVIANISGYDVPVYNIQSIFTSEAGRIFAEKNNKTVGIFSISGALVKLSFRSVGEQFPDALTLAKSFDLGGGGHKRAAAVYLPLKKFLEIIKTI